jgi:hypothetical protein
MKRTNRPKHVPFVSQSPYGKSSNGTVKIDKSSIIWRDFLNGVKRRKRLLNHIRNVGLDENDLSVTLKRLLFEMRQLTLKVIEDALEIEYRSQFNDLKAPVRAGMAMQLPPITSFRGLEGKEDLYMLTDMINDTDDLYSLPNIKAFLPLDFPATRNPFILGQDIDGLAVLEGPRPEPGNSAMELKALEFLRYKRAAKAMLRAEVQVLNKMPLMLEDIEHIWKFLTTDRNVSILIRTVITLLHSDNIHGTERGPELRYLVDESVYMNPPEFLRQLNGFKHEETSYQIELLAAIRHVLKDCSTAGFTDIATSFLTEWVRLIIGPDCFLSEERILSQNEVKISPVTKLEKKKRTDEHEIPLDASGKSNSNKDISKAEEESQEETQKKSSSNSLQKGGKGNASFDEPLKKLMSKSVGKKPRRSKHEDTIQLNGVSLESMNVLKYEIIKMQQELLKRKILDPKAYGLVPSKAHGTDAILGKMNVNKGQEMGVVQESNEMTPFSGAMESFNALLLLKELMFLKFSSEGFVEILVSPNRALLYTQYKREMPEDEQQLVTGESTQPPPQQLITFNSLNKLLFDRLTGFQLDSLVDMTEKIRKNTLSPFLSLIQSHLDRLAQPTVLRQQLTFACDMCVVRDVLITGNISVDVEVERSESSNGLIIRATPRQGSLLTTNKMELHPITLFVHDKELLVLLINQRGLYTLALTKWSCLEMVARWLLSRIQINRIPIPMYSSKASVNFDDTGTLVLPPDPSATSHRDLTHETTSVKTYFEVYLDRTVEIDQEIKQYWFAHNLPVLNGVRVNYDLTARQEMEMLYITIHLTLTFLHPSVTLRRKKEKEIEKMKMSTLYEFTSPYDDEAILDQQLSPNTWDIPFDEDPEVETHHLRFVFGLTGVELLMFGTGETLDEKNTSAAAASSTMKGMKSQSSHPPPPHHHFMKCIMSRLHLNYLGNKSQPHDDLFSCSKEENWEVKYSRRLLRNIRTVSGGTMILTVSGIGNDLLYESKPIDTVLYDNDIGSKLFSYLELEEIVKLEGWMFDLLEPSSRVTLAHRVMEKLKIILDHEKHRLEYYTFPETRLLEIVIQPTINKPELSIGLVEITSVLTLSELRIVINHELDRDLIPKLYRFIYKSSGCALKQEPFRKAWECLPKCYLVAKTIKEVNRSQDISIEKSQEAVERAIQKAKKMEEDAQKKNKLAKKLIPIPVPTLCMAQEGVWEIYLRHDASGLLQPGDILRIGHIESTDFIIPMGFSRILENAKVGAEQSDGTVLDVQRPVKVIPIDQYFLTFGESDQFIYGNTPFSALPPPPVVELEPEVYLDADGKAVIVEIKEIDPESLIPERYRYPNELKEKTNGETRGDGTNASNPVIEKDLRVNTTIDSQKKLSTTLPLMKQDSPGSLEQIKSTHPSMTLKSVTTDVVNKIISSNGDTVIEKSNSTREPGKIYRDMWVWKCVPRSEDRRPKWRQMYDNGEVVYQYTYQDSSSYEDPTLFHVTVPLKLIEEYCRDYRCEDMTIYHQRVQEMPHIPLSLYTDLTYTHLVNQVPVTTTQGIDEVKFINFLKSLGVFPDLHKPARISQLTLAFFREVNGSQGDETYLNYYGFCALIQEISLIRYPEGIFDLDECEELGEFLPDDGPPLPPAPLVPPVTIPPLALDAVPTPPLDTGRGSLADITKWQSQNFRRSSIGMVIIKKPRGKKKVIQNKKVKLEALDNPLVTQVDSRHAALAYRKFVTDYFITIPSVSDSIWIQAKDMTIEKEIYIYASSTRLAATWRRYSQSSKYHSLRHAVIILQSYIRMKQAIVSIHHLMKLYIDDWLFRLRYTSVILIQSIIRQYLCRCWYLQTMNQRREREIIVTRARRIRFSKLRIKEKKTIVFKQIRRINGVLVLLILRRKDQRNYSNDYGMRLEVYNPQFQLVNVFIIEESDLRRFMQDILLVNSLSIGDLLNKNNIERVISVRLLCRLSKRVGDPPKFILSRQALGQKGPKILTRGRVINNELFVCTLYETGYDLVVQCYHQHTSIIFPCTLLSSALVDWVTSVYHSTCHTEIEKQQQPLLLRPENRRHLHHWLIDQIVVDKRYGKFNVMFAIQYKRSVKMESIIKIQSIVRRAKARALIPFQLDEFILKVKESVSDEETCYYLNIHTGESSWNKPSLLRPHQDIPTQPYYRWVRLPYSVDEPLYVNPFTGKYTHLTPDGSARKIQAMIRNWMLKPFRLTKEEFAKGRAYELEAQTSYERDPKRLAFVLNYALITFCISLNYRLAKTLITESLALADANPTTTRLYAIYLLATCEAPLAVSREHAETLLRDAWRRDNEGSKFRTALTMFFKYACYRHPKSCHVLLNLGLVEYYIFKNQTNAERCLRRALAMAPFDELVMENWKKLRDVFPDSKRVYRPRGRLDKMAGSDAAAAGGGTGTGGGGKKTTIHGRPVLENLAWAGWVFVEMDVMFKDGESEYWYNPATGQSQKYMPEDWQKEWELRAWRSVYEGERDGLEHYFDPVTATYFQRHVLTNTYQ